MTATIPHTEICDNCGYEWPSRYGRHNCNMHRPRVHQNAVIVEPDAKLAEAVERLTARLYIETCQAAEYANLGGYDSPYRSVLADIDATIGRLRRFRHEVQLLAGHSHDWTDNDYCSICGADGRA